jgi:hypothetical protein
VCALGSASARHQDLCPPEMLKPSGCLSRKPAVTLGAKIEL